MSARLAIFAALLIAGAASAVAQSSDKDRDDERLRAAIAACDRGAASPLDPAATEPPVQFSELFGPSFDLASLRAVAAACRIATEGKPGEARLWLQWVRAELGLGDRFDPGLVGRIRSLASNGGAEASYLLFFIHRAFPDAGVDLAEAQAAIRAAAEAGHRDALATIVENYRYGPYFRRDQHEAARFAALLAELPKQGIGSPNAADTEAMAYGRLVAAGLPLMNAGFSTDEQTRAFVVIRDLYENGDRGAFVPYVTALRYGRGVEGDAAKVRALLETAVTEDNADALPVLAEMLAEGEGGPADGKRAIALLTSPLAERAAYAARPLLARLYLDNRYTGPRPRQALRLLADLNDIDARIRAARLFMDYDERLEYPNGYADAMKAATKVGEPRAAMAWALLRLSRHPQFGNKVDEARAILATLAAEGDAEAPILIAETQYVGLDTSSFNPPRREGGMTDPEIRSVVEAAIRNGQASAFRVMGKLQRVGVVYPQDEVAATKSLIEAAERGDVEAMVLLGDAYGDGLGVPENRRERLRWWREAARLGSLAAAGKLVTAFTFDSFDKQMTLREGITAKVALYNNGPTDGGPLGASTFMGTFTGGRALDAGYPALAEAVLDGFRAAPAGLDEVKLVPLARALPQEIRVEMEKVLARDGFLTGAPEGYFGPEVRAALAAWVEARGPLPDERPPSEEAPASPVSQTAIPPDVLGRVRQSVFARAERNDLGQDDLIRVIADINTLAQYGDLPSRWVLLRNYHQSTMIRRTVGAGDMTRYGLDLVVTRPQEAEKVDFEFIFTVSAMYQDGAIDAFGAALLDAVRDDARLQDPLTLGGVMQQALFAPGACDAIVEAAAKAGIADAGIDGCGSPAQAAVIAYAKEKGPAGVETSIRETAARAILAMDVAAN